MKTITIDIKDEYYEEFMLAIQEYIDKGLVEIVSSKCSETTDNA